MIELLKEQVYHTSVIQSMSSPPEYTSHPLLMEMDSAKKSLSECSQAKSSGGVVEQLSLLQSQMMSSQSETVAALANSMKEVLHAALQLALMKAKF